MNDDDDGGDVCDGHALGHGGGGLFNNGCSMRNLNSWQLNLNVAPYLYLT